MTEREIKQEVTRTRILYTELINQRIKILNEIRDKTDSREWTDTLYTDGFIIVLQKSGDWIYIDDYFNFCEKIKEQNITLEMFLLLSDFTRKKEGHIMYEKWNDKKDEFKHCIFTEYDLNLIKEKFVEQTF